MSASAYVLSPDTQAILLLCGNFQVESSEATAPLTLTDYNQLVQWLRSQALRPSDLLELDGIDRLRHTSDLLVNVERITKLLSRGGLLALQVESWTNRGLWVVSRSDQEYPQRLKDRLKHRAPPILYGAGHLALLSHGGLAIVGSRNADEKSLEFTREITQLCVKGGVQVISGGAKGVDQTAMQAGLETQGNVVGVLADSLDKTSMLRLYRDGIKEGSMALVSPYAPHVGFNVGNAMGRNKLIYALSDWTVVVSTDVGKGGTWTGALEALRLDLGPVFVRLGQGVPSGNVQLAERGAIRLESPLFGNSLMSITEILEQKRNHQLPQNSELSPEAPVLASKHKPQVTNTPLEPMATVIDGNTFWNEIVWPLMQRLVAQQGHLDKGLLSRSLSLTTTQADVWLQRAVAEGKLQKKIKPVRYVALENRQMSFISA